MLSMVMMMVVVVMLVVSISVYHREVWDIMSKGLHVVVKCSIVSHMVNVGRPMC